MMLLVRRDCQYLHRVTAENRGSNLELGRAGQNREMICQMWAVVNSILENIMQDLCEVIEESGVS